MLTWILENKLVVFVVIGAILFVVFNIWYGLRKEKKKARATKTTREQTTRKEKRYMRLDFIDLPNGAHGLAVSLYEDDDIITLGSLISSLKPNIHIEIHHTSYCPAFSLRYLAPDTWAMIRRSPHSTVPYEWEIVEGIPPILLKLEEVTTSI